MEIQGRGKEPVQPTQPSPVVVIPPSTLIADHGQLFSAFQKLQIPEFTGARTPDDTENWILRLEKNFEAMTLPEEYWVPFTAYKLEADVADWWNSIVSTKGRNLSWMEFLKIFWESYFPISWVHEKRLEFETIR